MKQAILITAYKDFKQLIYLVNLFDNTFNIYIHIDKKSKLNKENLVVLQECPYVRYVGCFYKINWGGVNHLKAYLELCKLAFQDKDNQYFHLITGQDYPIKSIKYFNEFFKAQNNIRKDYLEYHKLPFDGLSGGGLDRLKYYHLNDFFNYQSTKGYKNLMKIKYWQKKYNFKRSLKGFGFKNFYLGSTYWSLSRKTLSYVIDYTLNKPNFFNKLKYSHCPEEIYFQTIILNSKYAKNVVNKNLRFIDWSKGGSSPAYLSINHLNDIIKSDNLFARKIHSKSNDLINRIEANKLLNT